MAECRDSDDTDDRTNGEEEGKKKTVNAKYARQSCECDDDWLLNGRKKWIYEKMVKTNSNMECDGAVRSGWWWISERGWYFWSVKGEIFQWTTRQILYMERCEREKNSSKNDMFREEWNEKFNRYRWSRQPIVFSSLVSFYRRHLPCRTIEQFETKIYCIFKFSYSLMRTMEWNNTKFPYDLPYIQCSLFIAHAVNIRLMNPDYDFILLLSLGHCMHRQPTVDTFPEICQMRIVRLMCSYCAPLIATIRQLKPLSIYFGADENNNKIVEMFRFHENHQLNRRKCGKKTSGKRPTR